MLLYKERPENEWVGPYKVIAKDNKNLLLNVNGRIMTASVYKSSFARWKFCLKDIIIPIRIPTPCLTALSQVNLFSSRSERLKQNWKISLN